MGQFGEAISTSFHQTWVKLSSSNRCVLQLLPRPPAGALLPCPDVSANPVVLGEHGPNERKKKERFHRGIKFPFFPWKELIKLDRSINQCPTTTTLHFRRTASDFLRPPQTGAQPWGTTAWHWWIYWAIPRGPDISVHPQLDYGQNPFLFFCWLA